MWGISILADFIPMGYKHSCCGSLLFKYILGHCVGRKTKSKSNDCSEYSLTQEKNGIQIESKLMVIRKH